MKKLNLLQGTKEWLEIRLSHLTASEAPAMMNASKYLSRNELLDLKKSGVAKPVNEHTQKLFDKGHEAEDLARNIIELEFFENLPPLVGTFEFKGLPLLASFDGISEDNSLIWEHKLTNQTLVENVKNGLLEPHYYWQLEHQLLVSGAEKAMFTCSDGTEENMVSMTYVSLPERRQQLVDGWQQFAKDLSKHEVKAKTEKVVATKADNFPMITFEVIGTTITSNASQCLGLIKGRIAVELSKTLETDQDFADAKDTVKQVKKARENLKTLQQDVKDQFESYRDFSLIAKEMDTVLQKFGANREKDVKAAEQAKKMAIIIQANTELGQLLFALQTEFNGVAVIVNNDFNGVIKNKRTIESIQNAVDSELARCKIRANEQATKIRANLKTLNDLASDYQYLFNDSAELVSTKENDDLVNLIKSRINEHEQAQAERQRQEQERIELAAKEKAEREAKAELERKEQIIRNEERANIEFERKAQAKIDAEEKRKAQIIENDRLLKEREENKKAFDDEAARKAQVSEQHKTVEDELKEITEHELCCSNEFTSQEPLQPLPLPKTAKSSAKLNLPFDDIVCYFMEHQALTINQSESIANAIINGVVPHVAITRKQVA